MERYRFDPDMLGKSKAAMWLSRHMPDRKIILASQGIYRHVAVSSFVQASAVFCLFLLMTWGIFVSYRYFAHDGILAAREQELAELRTAHRVLAGQSSEQRMQIAKLEQELGERNTQIAALTGRGESLNKELASLRSRLEAAEGDKARLAEARENVQRQLAGIQDMISVGKGRSTSPSHAQRSGVVAMAVGEIPRRADEKMHVGTSTSPRGAPIAEGLVNLESGLTDIMSQRDKALNDQDALKSRLAQLDVAFSDMQASQVHLLERISTLTVGNVGDIEKAFALVGLDANKLMERNRSNSGIGGPFIPAGTDFGSPELRATLASLNTKIDRLDNMSAMLRSLPLASPLDNYTLNSAFGTRNDPINELTGIHEGIDLGSPYRQPSVHATAPGRVVFAGWRGRYGRMVEIDHGNGIHTRYAHLSKVAVRVGQKLDTGASIGNMGNSGRSTGQHLHYEVLVDGKPRDPMKFLKAGKHVLKKQAG